ncbi:MAG: 6-carboxytetrahydropterin synthase [Usitatibacter sp.]
MYSVKLPAAHRRAGPQDRRDSLAVEVSYRFGFDAAHHFNNFPDGHPYGGIHGHSFQVEVAIAGRPDPTTGFIADLAEVEKACLEVRADLDHRVLNDIEGLATPASRTCACGSGARSRRASPISRASPCAATPADKVAHTRVVTSDFRN